MTATDDQVACPGCTHDLSAHRKVSKGAGCTECGCGLDSELVLLPDANANEARRSTPVSAPTPSPERREPEMWHDGACTVLASDRVSDEPSGGPGNGLDGVLVAQAERERRRSSFWRPPTALTHRASVTEPRSNPQPRPETDDGDTLDHYAVLRRHLASESRAADGSKRCCVCGSQKQVVPASPGGVYVCPVHHPEGPTA